MNPLGPISDAQRRAWQRRTAAALARRLRNGEPAMTDESTWTVRSTDYIDPDPASTTGLFDDDQVLLAATSALDA